MLDQLYLKLFGYYEDNIEPWLYERLSPYKDAYDKMDQILDRQDQVRQQQAFEAQAREITPQDAKAKYGLSHLPGTHKVTLRGTRTFIENTIRAWDRQNQGRFYLLGYGRITQDPRDPVWVIDFSIVLYPQDGTLVDTYTHPQIQAQA